MRPVPGNGDFGKHRIATFRERTVSETVRIEDAQHRPPMNNLTLARELGGHVVHDGRGLEGSVGIRLARWVALD